MATVLLVDDSESLRALLQQALMGGGYRVLTASDGKRAFALLASNEVDLIVTDIYMPNADGIELLTALTRLKRRPPVIAMSSKTGPMDMLRSAKLLGAKMTLKKPFAPDELLRCADTLLGVKHPAQGRHESPAKKPTRKPFL